MKALKICEVNIKPTLNPTFLVPNITVMMVGNIEKLAANKPNNKQTQIIGIALPEQYGHKNNKIDNIKLMEPKVNRNDLL